MKLEADARIPFPRSLVFETYRDRLPGLVPYLPDIKLITVQKRTDDADGQTGVTKLENLWESSAQSKIPKVAQSIIKPEMLAWMDYATWDQNAWTCDWRTELRLFTESVKCSGKNTYVEDGENTILQIRGELDIDMATVPGVPRFLAGKIAPKVEKFIVDLLTPNLLSVADGLESFLKNQ